MSIKTFRQFDNKQQKVQVMMRKITFNHYTIYKHTTILHDIETEEHE